MYHNKMHSGQVLTAQSLLLLFQLLSIEAASQFKRADARLILFTLLLLMCTVSSLRSHKVGVLKYAVGYLQHQVGFLQHGLMNCFGTQVAQKVGRRRGVTQREGKKPKPQGRVYLEYPSNPVTAKEGSTAVCLLSMLWLLGHSSWSLKQMPHVCVCA